MDKVNVTKDVRGNFRFTSTQKLTICVVVRNKKGKQVLNGAASRTKDVSLGTKPGYRILVLADDQAPWTDGKMPTMEEMREGGAEEFFVVGLRHWIAILLGVLFCVLAIAGVVFTNFGDPIQLGSLLGLIVGIVLIYKSRIISGAHKLW